MDCQIRRAEEVAEVVLVGSLDSSWSAYFSDRIDEVVRGGALEVRVDMSGVSYFSSNGIALLIRYHPQCGRSADGSGSWPIRRPSAMCSGLPASRRSFAMKPPSAAPRRPRARREAIERRWHGPADFRVRNGPGPERLELIGDPTRLPARGYDAADERTWRAVPGRCHRLRRTGPSFEACRGRFGEFLAVAGVAAYRPSQGRAGPISSTRPARSFLGSASSTGWRFRRTGRPWSGSRRRGSPAAPRSR